VFHRFYYTSDAVLDVQLLSFSFLAFFNFVFAHGLDAKSQSVLELVLFKKLYVPLGSDYLIIPCVSCAGG
jgi:hypothetical protein